MPQKRNSAGQDHYRRIVNAALDLAAEKSWSDITLRDIAAASGVKLADLRQQLSSKDAVLDAFAADIDAQLPDMLDPEAAAAPARDRLFELLMARFDLIADRKDALRSIMSGLAGDPAGIVPGLVRLSVSMRWTLETAGISTGGPRGLLRVKFLSAAFLATLRAWLRDDSPDMAMTMATIDRWLTRAEDFEARLSEWPWSRNDGDSPGNITDDGGLKTTEASG